MENFEPLAKAGIPVLHVCGSSDPLFEKSTRMAEERYQKPGGKIKVIVGPGKGHYPLTQNDPKAAIDFITAAAH
jgi:pimeloyl-ACP methyl ester carboxylesterase